MKKTVFLTGATGVMGSAGLKELSKKLDRFNIVLLARDSKVNRKKLAPYFTMDGVKVVWGNLLNYDDVLKGVTGADYVLHVGGMVSPAADYFPKRTIKTNVGAAENIVKAVLAQPNKDEIKVVYIGTVAQTSDRSEPIHWGRTGDPICISVYDHYAISKTRAEKVAQVANQIPELTVEGDKDADLLIVGWGSTRGHLMTAMQQLQAEGKKCALAHFNYICPLPKNTAEVLKKYKKIVVCELNSGQFAQYLRAQVPGEYMQYNKVEGQPFNVGGIVEYLKTL